MCGNGVGKHLNCHSNNDGTTTFKAQAARYTTKEHYQIIKQMVFNDRWRLFRRLCLEKTLSFSVLPTGYGKSVIYALLPLLEQQIPPTNYFHAISLTSSGSTNSSEVKDTKNTGTP